MRALLHLFTDVFRPARRGLHANRAPADVYLKPLILLLIGLLVGPDLLAVVELTTLLELLGAAMFIVAFAAGYKLIAATWLGWLRRLLLPAEFAWLFAIPGRPSAIVFGTLFVARNGLQLFVLGVVTYVSVAIVTGIAA